MVTYTVYPNQSIDYGATGHAAILQNVEMILTTIRFDQPMARAMAWEAPVDRPLEVAQMQVMPMIVEAIENYEPRVRVIDVVVDKSHETGSFHPTVKVVIKDDEQSI